MEKYIKGTNEPLLYYSILCNDLPVRKSLFALRVQEFISNLRWCKSLTQP